LSNEKPLYAGVHILNTLYAIDNTYDYHVPPHLQDNIGIGSIVVVPFGGGNKPKTAVVTSLSHDTGAPTTKPVLSVPKYGFRISEELLGLCRFMKEQCYCTIGDAVRTIMPSGLSVRNGICYIPCENTDNAAEDLHPAARNILSYIRRNKRVSVAELKTTFGLGAQTCATSLEKLNFIQSETDYEYHINEKNDKYVVLIPEEEELSELVNSKMQKLSIKQNAVLNVLMQSGMTSISDIIELTGVGASVIKELEKKGIVKVVPIQSVRTPYDFASFQKKEKTEFSLSEEQTTALDALVTLYKNTEAKAALLFGVTGSGKTNVILKLIDRVLADGKSVIMLVPEIALTSQTVGIFATRYGDRVSVLHSALSAGEKLDTWRKIYEGKSDIVIGTRSAVFAPVHHLGLIVIDEEQETSFKSDMSPKYHARDIARYRCAKAKSLMLLASATPSVESYYKAQSGTYALITLENRYGKATLPEVILYDMKAEPFFLPPDDEKGKPALPLMVGARLRQEIEQNLLRNEQTILFINRRGYQSFSICRKCGSVLKCPNCSVSLTYHKQGNYGGGKMLCHYCGYSETPPKLCPVCGSEHTAFMGSGTQLLEETLKDLFPTARLLRMDLDTTSGKMSHDTILSSFRNREADILLGTQMVTKGHDFPQVSLVGVILADNSLYLGDFRANERTFSMITQVLGRAGRGEISGRAIIQTYSPEHESLTLSATQNYAKFFEGEIQVRKAAVFPPFCDIITVGFSSEVENDCLLSVKSFGVKLDELCKNSYSDVKLIVYGPFQAGIYKLSGKYRMRYIIKCKNNKRVRELFSKLYSDFSKGIGKNVSISLDVNPSGI